MTKLSNMMPQVVVLLDGPYMAQSRILRGILRFTQLRTPWALDVRTGRAGEPTTFDEADWNATGVIANRVPPDLAALVRRHRTPLFVINDIARELKPVGRILYDNTAVARLAADHLVDAGFTDFAFVEERSNVAWSVERKQLFTKEIAARGFTCRIYESSRNGDADDSAALRDWLAALPRPTALLAACDIRARHVLDACRAAGLDVPGDIAILGVDDDESICETAMPTISSIAMSTEDAGFKAAEILAAVMESRHLGGSNLSRIRQRRPIDVFYGGTHVVERRSTKRDTVRDALVSRCRVLMEANAGRKFNVADLVLHLNVSRRTLETHFRAATGQSLNDEITALRIRRAKNLLAKTSMSQAEIAAECGFCDASHMNVIFRRHCSALPSAFR